MTTKKNKSARARLVKEIEVMKNRLYEYEDAMQRWPLQFSKMSSLGLNRLGFCLKYKVEEATLSKVLNDVNAPSVQWIKAVQGKIDRALARLEKSKERSVDKTGKSKTR